MDFPCGRADFFRSSRFFLLCSSACLERKAFKQVSQYLRVLPSFFIILLIAALIHNLLQYAGVNAFLSGIRPCVVALILATAVTMGLSSLLGVSTLADTPAPAWQGIGILAALLLLHFGWQKWKGKAPSPIAMILVSAVLGMVVYH